MSLSCQHEHTPDFTGNDPIFRRILLLVILINGVMFFLEMAAGHWSGSQSLLADALDFMADTVTYGLSFVVIGLAPVVRARAAMVKAGSLVLMGFYVLFSTVYQIFILETPVAFVMGGVAVLALIANLLSVALLYRWRQGDANIRSVWLCSRNDAIGNVAVFLAALGVFGTSSAWPDLLVAFLMASLFLQSALRIFRVALHEIRHAGHHHHDQDSVSDPHHHH